MDHLTKQHAKELLGEEPSLDRAFYLFAQEKEMLKLFTVRDEGKLVGYASFVISSDHHFKDRKIAAADALFVSPDYRGKLVGSKLIEFTDEMLKAMGCHSVFHHVNLEHDFGPILERKGYSYYGKQYRRTLWN